VATAKIEINRAPVLTLWAAVVAEALGFEPDEALTLGKTLAGLTAQSKGRRLGIYKPAEERKREAREQPKGEMFSVELLGRSIPALNTPEGVRAASKGQPVDPESVQRYLSGKFGESLDDVRAAMADLASAYDADELEGIAFGLYEKFRPQIPSGKKGWGAKGELDLAYIRSLGQGSAGK
jgi:hypothetical protein